MPMIVYKTMDLNVLWAQTRRLACESCRQPFVMVHADSFTAQTTGLPLLSGDEGMRQAVVKQALGRLRALARRRNLGAASCPHCGKPQSWMVGRAYATNVGCFTLGLAAAGFVAGAIWAGAGDLREPLVPLAGLTLLGAALGVGLGIWRARSRFVRPGERDARTMTDAEFGEFLAKCEAGNADHALTWHFTVSKTQPGEKTMVVSLGFLDLVGGLQVPPDVTTDQILGGMEGEAARPER